MNLKDFLNIILSFEWNNLKFLSSNEDSGGIYEVASLDELFNLLAEEIPYNKDKFTILNISNLDEEEICKNN